MRLASAVRSHVSKGWCRFRDSNRRPHGGGESFSKKAADIHDALRADLALVNSQAPRLPEGIRAYPRPVSGPTGFRVRLASNPTSFRALRTHSEWQLSAQKQTIGVAGPTLVGNDGEADFREPFSDQRLRHFFLGIGCIGRHGGAAFANDDGAWLNGHEDPGSRLWRDPEEPFQM